MPIFLGLTVRQAMPKKKFDAARRHHEVRRSFTVVTPNYNMAGHLGPTIESVLQNLGPGDEYFIIDGGSTDSSTEVIRAHEHRLSGWVSEPDAGYADAVAKGFRMARGDYLCWVNSGDLLLDGALEKARNSLQRTGADLIFGDDLLIDEQGNVIQVTNGHASDLRAMMLYAGWTPLQESCFWTRALYEKVGGIDPAVKYAADYDFFLRTSLIGRCEYCPAIFGAFRRHDGQLSMAKTAQYRAEREECRTRELDALPSNALLPLINFYHWFKVRWRVRVHARKRDMDHLRGKAVGDVVCQDTGNGHGVARGD
ncbi:glycosyltransferase family 2 protein [Hydrogenophaga sp.]|uniref:glycosyltransferase family 2 protein n=1 Tax=Hydrogenophaga sp. TaxID=1904254 RepID=UPI003D0F1E5E